MVIAFAISLFEKIILIRPKLILDCYAAGNMNVQVVSDLGKCHIGIGQTTTDNKIIPTPRHEVIAANRLAE